MLGKFKFSFPGKGLGNRGDRGFDCGSGSGYFTGKGRCSEYYYKYGDGSSNGYFTGQGKGRYPYVLIQYWKL